MSSITAQKLAVRVIIAILVFLAFGGLVHELHPSPELSLTLYTALIAFFTFMLTRPIDESPPGGGDDSE